MAPAELRPTTPPKTSMLTMRAHAFEIEHLRRVARERGTTVANLVREGLRQQGALPPE